MIWIEFGICAVLIVAAATQLSRYADVIAEKTGLGRAWVGAILLAGVTSLPELVSGSFCWVECFAFEFDGGGWFARFGYKWLRILRLQHCQHRYCDCVCSGGAAYCSL